MICIVTGAAGFIGSHLCQELLRAWHFVVGIDCFTDYYSRECKEKHLAAFRAHPRFTLKQRDLCTEGLRIPRGADVVFHLAAQPGVRPSWGEQFTGYLHHNIAATQALLEAITREPGPRCVFQRCRSLIPI